MRTIPVLLLALMLSACLGRQEAQSPTASYDFSPVAMSGSGPLPKVEVLMPAWLNTQTVQYRLLYRDPNQLHDYAFARWAGAPAALIQQRLRLRLAGSMVAGSACSMQVNVQEFVQTFASAERSEGDLRAEVRMLDGQRKVLATRFITAIQPAPAADARGGIAALASAVDQLAKEAGSWVRDEASLKTCRQ
ncbi:MAG TPA: ABC-type transport auxiliary lipoprotein family protein [Rhodocyclaceae bacterium]|nr:ABC-type transport auxiliary lipoprotein family protein [Rhodocyclaceae bacterium]